MIAAGQQRRKFLHRFCGLGITIAPMIFLQGKPQLPPEPRPLNNADGKPDGRKCTLSSRVA